MSLSHLDLLLALAPPPAGTQQDPKAAMLSNFGLIAIMLVVLYVVMIRGPQKKAREHDTLLKSIKAGDKIVTNSGIVAVVITVKEKTLSVRSADAKLEITKGSVAEITERSGEPEKS
jgi:preprotein translocase subunit YajC